MTQSIVIYHASCVDGFTSAWIARRALGDSAEYVPASYGDEPPDVAGKDVYILDFSYKRSIMEELIAGSAKLVCIDHHKTAADELANLCSDKATIIFDLSGSGAVLTWDYFFQKGFSPYKIPRLIRYVQDRDLWTWKLDYSREISAAIASYPMDVATWDFLHYRMSGGSSGMRGMRSEGEAILRYQSGLIESAVSHAREITLAGHRVLAVNATCLMSEIGERLAMGRPFGATWYWRGDGNMAWSLRSADDGIDVSEIAGQFGGGGHPRAAGFLMELMSFVDMMGYDELTKPYV